MTHCMEERSLGRSVSSFRTVCIQAVAKLRPGSSAVAASSSGRPRERTGTVYPEGAATGRRLGGGVLSIQATTAEFR